MLKFLKYKEGTHIIIGIIIKSSKINRYTYIILIGYNKIYLVIELCLLSYKLLYGDVNLIYELNLKNFKLIYIYSIFNLGYICIL